MPQATTRREFLRNSAPAAATIAPNWLTAKSSGAQESTSKNDRPNIGAIGVGGKDSHILGEAARFGEVVAVCDVERTHAERAKTRYGGRPDVYGDSLPFDEHLRAFGTQDCVGFAVRANHRRQRGPRDAKPRET